MWWNIVFAIFLFALQKETATTPAPTLEPPPPCDNRTSVPLLSYTRNLQNHLFYSSSAVDNFPAFNARLNREGDGTVLCNGGCWMARYNHKEFLEVDLLDLTVLTGIAVQGCSNIPAWTRSFTLMYRYAANFEWKYYEDKPGVPKVFQANNDQITITRINFGHIFQAKFVQIIPQTWHNTASLRFELYGYPAEKCSSMPALSGELLVYMTASSSAEDSKPHYARLNLRRNGVSGWVPAAMDTNQYLKITFGNYFLVRGVRMQGRGDSDMWLTLFKVSYLSAGEIYYIQEPFGIPKVFEGNVDRHSIVTRSFLSPVSAWAIRIHPVAYHQGIGIRTEIDVCLRGCLTNPLIIGRRHRVPDRSFYASSQESDQSGPERSRLNTQREGALTGGWVAGKLTKTEFIQVDLGIRIRLRGVSTQGRADKEEWVTSYQIMTSIFHLQFSFYEEDGAVRV